MVKVIYWFEDAYHTENPYFPPVKTLLGARDAINSRCDTFNLPGNRAALQDTREVIDRYSAILLCRQRAIFNDRGEQKKPNATVRPPLTWAAQKPGNSWPTSICQRSPRYGLFHYRQVSSSGQRLGLTRRPGAGTNMAESKSYAAWWEKTYGAGGTQNSHY